MRDRGIATVPHRQQERRRPKRLHREPPSPEPGVPPTPPLLAPPAFPADAVAATGTHLGSHRPYPFAKPQPRHPLDPPQAASNEAARA
jgi:hypothetical protein